MHVYHNPLLLNRKNFRNSVIDVTTAATLICPHAPGRHKVYLATFSTSPIFMGDAKVAASSGFPLVSPDGKTLAVQVFETIEALHGIVANGTATVYVWEEQ